LQVRYYSPQQTHPIVFQQDKKEGQFLGYPVLKQLLL
jgi:hypothetical protein